MFGLIGALFAGIEIFSNIKQKPVGNFNSQLYLNDATNGVSTKDVLKRHKNGYYSIQVEFIKPESENKNNLPEKVLEKNYDDYMKLYNIDKEFAEKVRKAGLYSY